MLITQQQGTDTNRDPICVDLRTQRLWSENIEEVGPFAKKEENMDSSSSESEPADNELWLEKYKKFKQAQRIP